MFRACFLVGAAASATLGARGVFLCEVFAPLAWPERGFSEQRATDGEQELAIGISLLACWPAGLLAVGSFKILYCAYAFLTKNV